MQDRQASSVDFRNVSCVWDVCLLLSQSFPRLLVHLAFGLLETPVYPDPSPFHFCQFKQVSVTCDRKSPKVNFTLIMAQGTSPANEAAFLHDVEIKTLSLTRHQKIIRHWGQQRAGKPSGRAHVKPHTPPPLPPTPTSTLKVVGTPTLCYISDESRKAADCL